MNLCTRILFVAVMFSVGSLCDDENVTVFVRVPTDRWQRIESKTSILSKSIKKLVLVAQHDAAERNWLKEAVDSVSDPTSAEYGNFISYDDVYRSLLSKTTDNGLVLERWAKLKGLAVTRTTKNKQFLLVEASVDKIEQIFQAKLYTYQHKKTGRRVLRSTSYQLPLDIHRCVAFIDGLSAFPTLPVKDNQVKETAKSATNRPIIHRLDSGFGHYLFYIQLVCYDGKPASNSLCANRFRGFQIKLSQHKNTFKVPVAETNCEVCSKATPLIALFCGRFSLGNDTILCRFYLNQTDSVPLYEPHNVDIRTKFKHNKYSEYATYRSAVEKVIDITPPVLRSLYNVNDSPTEQRDNRSRQAIAGFYQEYLNMKSFNSFASIYGKEFKLVFGNVYGANYNISSRDELETSLDLQYMASMGSRIPVDYISSPDEYEDTMNFFFVQLALLEEDKKNVVPLVYSISYGDDEIGLNESYIHASEVQFMIMSLTGKTVFASSGDSGVSGTDGICREKFYPGYPGSSAYVTSVGATQFIKATTGCQRKWKEYCLEEVVAAKSFLTGSRITSGGGFSNFVSRPSYQDKYVKHYLKHSKNLLPPGTYYNQTNRAYPDVSLAGHQYQLKVYGTSDLFLDGTSASSPALAGLVSLIVNQRLKLGKKPLGLLNPLLYSLSTTNPSVFYDINKGNISCSTLPTCCRYGFVAAKKWDPATGLGSINHKKLMKMLIEN